MAEHGLSVYIETGDKTILFDTGASDLLIKNAGNLKVDLKKVQHVVISHGHYDHTLGLPAFCMENQTADIYIHKDAFEETYGVENGSIEKESSGILWGGVVKQGILARSVLTENVMKLSKDIIISGTIPDTEGFEPAETFYKKVCGQKGETVFEADNMSHEQFLAIRDRDSSGVSRGVYIFSGCSHKGVTGVIKYAKELFPGEKIKGLIAGMHLYNADENTRKKVISEILNADIEMAMPVHCTGINAICDLKAAMGNKCIAASAGETYVY